MDFTIISRLSDGFPLSEGWDPGKQKGALSILRKQANLLIKQVSVSWKQQRHASNEIERKVIDGDNAKHRFYSLAGGSLIIMSLFESAYPKHLALVFMDEIRKAFFEELKREHGISINYGSIIETARTPYQYIRFDRVIQKKRVEFKDPRSHESLKRLNQSLTEVSQIMQTNIADLLLRGENLEDVSRKADDLKEKSRTFAKVAKRLSARAALAAYLPFIIVGGIVTLALFWVWRYT
eukprot:Protomagalhaensia_wolfi_Nauph_80__3231@NODE_3293_length_835_cov_108_432161_g2584_i0_p1_GENE_NODE_3293_length_835_cov_108_432161_g2584_i0NODE_3293_length_835_cov_108_432161_g2584_i0_p1_ORF_typecomplete_len237_score46_51Synaptobrevin/PF00957_21/5_7e19Longin/PF13774_6/0_00081SLM4/PF16818_5/0_014MCU/PF04678_13/0_072Serine_rich/PF08824_10/3_7e02Serine_rich/PF08824_10/1Serine_rich/PF08824_10/2_3e02Fzo_mitofusin/PF04799_13/3_8e03Fzo_mitofusin/PF04799_13/0_17Fzo_mitofusin/PF04799_13/4e03_NODE_3293_lengt